MAQLVIEGVWEEVLAQQEKLRGKRVRVTVLEESATEVQTEAKKPFGVFAAFRWLH